jgi:hypothetical protein
MSGNVSISVRTKKYTRPSRRSMAQNAVQVLYPRLHAYDQSDTRDELIKTCVRAKNCTSWYEVVGK